jgi:hypothetical protein
VAKCAFLLRDVVSLMFRTLTIGNDINQSNYEYPDGQVHPGVGPTRSQRSAIDGHLWSAAGVRVLWFFLNLYEPISG